MPGTAQVVKERTQDRVLKGLSQGLSIVAACRAAGVSDAAYRKWRQRDEFFARKADEVMRRDPSAPDPDAPLRPVLGFAEWRARYVHRATFAHQQQWVDVVEGRDPDPLEGCEWVPATRRLVVINTPPHHSKAMALDTRVLTTHGWSTIGELRVGERVFGPDGMPTTVLGKSEVFDKPCFRVRASSGESFVVSEDHLWTVSDGRRSGRVRALLWETLTTREMFERGCDFVLPSTGVLLGDEVPLPLDPYVLGAWLGDGHRTDGYLTSADPQVVEQVVAAGFAVQRVASGRGQASTYGFAGLARALHELGVLYAKRVPEGYLLASSAQRLALLQGLMDTDGTVSVYGQCSFSNTDEGLVRAVLFLASSLGERPVIREFRAMLDGKDCGPAWQVTWTPRNGEVVPFRLDRKASRVGALLDGARPSTVRLRRVTVEPAPTEPTQCIVVDNDSHLFLVGDSLVPTHNSQTLTVDYVTYRICMDPNVHIGVISKTDAFAKDFVQQVRDRFENGSGEFDDMVHDYAPKGGWRKKGGAWSQQQLDVAGSTGDSKDHTLTSAGWRSQINGKRFDLILVDDVVDDTNMDRFEEQANRLETTVLSRTQSGQVVVIGTRWASRDLYSHLLDGGRYASGVSPWSYLRQPMVVAFGADPSEWKTLWPRSDHPIEQAHPDPSAPENKPDKDGLYVAWDGPACEAVQRRVPPKTWALMYQQESVADDVVFDPTMVSACVDHRRRPGLLVAGAPGHPVRGMDGMWVIGTMDPAPTGDTFVIVEALDVATGDRWVLDAWVQDHATVKWIEATIRRVTTEFHVNEWVIEKQAVSGFLLQNEEIRRFTQSAGVPIIDPYTGSNKNDVDWGVEAMAPLFGTKHHDGTRWLPNYDGLMHLPDPSSSLGIRTLIQELMTWVPGVRGSRLRQDGVMALWFAEKRARVKLAHGEHAQTHMSIPGMNRRQQALVSSRRVGLRGLRMAR